MTDTQTNGNNAGSSAGTGSGSAQKGVPHDVVNNDWLAERELAEAVAKAAKVEGRAAALEAEGVTQAFAQDVLARLTQAGNFITTITTAHSDSGGATRGEGDARTALIKAAGSIQSGARRKFARSQPERLKLYACGGGVDLFTMNRAQLSAAIPTLIQTAKADGLSGAADAKTNAVQAAFDAWNAFDDTQTASGTVETTAREALQKLLFGPDLKGESGIIADRRSIQYAADGAWSPGTEIAIRREFHLQDKRRFAG